MQISSSCTWIKKGGVGMVNKGEDGRYLVGELTMIW